ncbi:LptE family protein [Mucilaginibacter sp.]
MKKIFVGVFVAVMVFLTIQSCTVKLNGASTQGLTTINIGYFENDAPYVLPTLSQDFTEALKARIRSTTSLDIVRTEQADAVMTGSITGYSIAPASIQAVNSNTPPIAGASALTITVEVKYVNNVEKHYSYQQSFSESKNFTGDIASQQNTLVPALITQITEDIFNKAFANW